MRPGATPGQTAACGGGAAVCALVLTALLSGCTGLTSAANAPEGAAPSASVSSAVPPVRVGRPGATQRVTFVPELLILPGRAEAGVVPAATVNGELKVPEHVDYVGWWDGSAYAGDPFGRTVIAGHVDSANGSDGFFVRLERIKQGDVVTLRAGERRLSYEITAVQVVARQALATDSQAFDQSGAHRLVLITCTGSYRRDRGGYESNLVVIGQPLGLAR